MKLSYTLHSGRLLDISLATAHSLRSGLHQERPFASQSMAQGSEWLLNKIYFNYSSRSCAQHCDTVVAHCVSCGRSSCAQALRHCDSPLRKMKLSIVIPTYNEQENIAELYRRLKAALKKDFKDFEYEIIYADDGSKDNSLALLKQLGAQDKNIKVISFSRNFGHHIAVTAGLDNATGDYIVTMDGDLQDQPEEIIKLYNKLCAGYDVVAGERINKNFGPLKRLSSHLFVSFIKYMTDKRILINNTIFRIMTKQVLDEVKKLREMHRYLVGIFGWVGFRHTTVAVEHGKRFAGKSKYNFRKRLNLAFDAIVSFSDRLLRLISYFGFFMVVASCALICLIIFRKFAYGIPVVGWASLITTILFVSGVQILILGVLAEYIGRTYMETKNRPLYVIKETVNL